MISQEAIHAFVKFLTDNVTNLLIPLMIIGFFTGVMARFLVYFTVKREEWFAKEFEKRVHKHIDSHEKIPFDSFYVVVKKMIEKTYYELFVVRSIMKRRKPDYVMAVSDRVFLIQHGCAWFVKDTLKQIRYLKHEKGTPKILEIAKIVFQNNPCFNRVFGIIPVNGLSDITNILPGLLIIGGIFGTFLGIMQGLPELGGMDLNNMEQTKNTMDTFLLKISFSMSTSIVGIILSVMMTVINSIWSPEKLFISIVDRFENSLDILWNRAKNNDLPEDISDFDEHRDPLDALAEESIDKEIASAGQKGKKFLPKQDDRRMATHDVNDGLMPEDSSLPKSPDEEDAA